MSGWKSNIPGVFRALVIHVCIALTASGETYYVDAVNGDNALSGTSPENAWVTLSKVNSTVFAPGDRILFRSGQTFVGQLWPKGSGSAGSPILIDRFDGDARPWIDGGGNVVAVLRLHNQQYWDIRNLGLRNLKPLRGENCGVLVTVENFGTAHGIRLSGLEIRDINGTSQADIRSAFGVT